VSGSGKGRDRPRAEGRSSRSGRWRSSTYDGSWTANPGRELMPPTSKFHRRLASARRAIASLDPSARPRRCRAPPPPRAPARRPPDRCPPGFISDRPPATPPSPANRSRRRRRRVPRNDQLIPSKWHDYPRVVSRRRAAWSHRGF